MFMVQYPDLDKPSEDLDVDSSLLLEEELDSLLTEKTDSDEEIMSLLSGNVAAD